MAPEVETATIRDGTVAVDPDGRFRRCAAAPRRWMVRETGEDDASVIWLADDASVDEPDLWVCPADAECLLPV